MTSPKALGAVAVLVIGAFMVLHGAGNNLGVPTVANQGATPAPTATQPAFALPSASPVPSAAPTAYAVNLAHAQSAATAFATTYMAYIYGRAPIASVQNVSDYVRAQLPGTYLTYVSPSHQMGPYTVSNVAVTPVEPEGTLIVVATVSESGPWYNVSFNMSPQGSSWATNEVPTFG